MATSFFRAIVAKMGSSIEIEKPLSEWAAVYFGAGAKVQALKRLSGGASQETWAFDVAASGTKHALILRRAPGGVAAARSSEAVSLATEAALLGATAKSGVRVPDVLHVSPPGSALGEAFVMRRVTGETLGRKILRDEEFTLARTRLTRDCGEALARIHAVPIAGLPELPRSLGEDQIAKYEAIYRGFDLPRPVFELAFAWLKANAPAPAVPVLVHGDFRLGNLIVDAEGLGAVLDWELAHTGDPREDIAWLCVNSWRFGQSERRVGGFGDLPDLLDAYAGAGGARFTPAEIDWWEILGSLKWGVMCMIMYGAYKTGADPSVERAAIGRRVSENEIDLINLFEGLGRHA
ncbi:phosphotransferase family protein [Hyphomonas sp.]|uniref:phosphotransferase family protein n=1 Tax=Hyphomonas sp. TaxID=87 RepID=UPI0025BA2CEB|nr:phosphotransferase family protein [Hyphomonas sp.]